MGIKSRAILFEQSPEGGVSRFVQLHTTATGSIPAAAASNEGSIIYDDTTNTVKFSDGSSWANIGVAGSAGTLDQAYDSGGVGGGRTITADGGAVAITVTNTSNNGALTLTQNDTTNNPVVLTLTNTGTGNDITATNWSITKAGLATIPTLTATTINSSGTTALTTMTATTATIGTLTTTTNYMTALASAASGNIALTVDAAGSGTIGIGTISTGAITLGAAVTVATGKSMTFTNGNITLSAGTLIATAGAGDGDVIAATPITTQAVLSSTLPAAYTYATGAINLSASTGSGPLIKAVFTGAYTGAGLTLDMTNAVGANAISLTGAGTRTAGLVTITDVPTTSAPSIDLNITPGASIQAGIDIDVAGTSGASIITCDFSAAHTGPAIDLTMANAVAARAIKITGSGTRTVPLIDITDTPGASGGGIKIASTSTNASGIPIVITEAGTSTNPLIKATLSAAYAGKAIYLTMSNAAAGAQGLVIDGTLAASGPIVALSSSGILTNAGSILSCTSSTQPGAANSGVVARFLETGTAQATTYAVKIDSTNNEALTVTTGRAHFVESISSLASNACGIVQNYVQAGGLANAITVAAITDAAGTTIPLVDGLMLVIDLNTLTLQAGVNTLNYAGGGALSIVKSSAPTTNKAVAVAANGVVKLIYSSGVAGWLDLAE